MDRCALGSRRARGARAGFARVELAVAASVLMIAVVGVVSARTHARALRAEARERALAREALRAVAEDLQRAARAEPSAAWARALQAACAPGGHPGARFAVEGLAAPAGEASVGRVRLVCDESVGDGELGVALGMPRDLNGDGDACDRDASAGARLLPVVVTLRWRGADGVRELRHGFYLAGP